MSSTIFIGSTTDFLEVGALFVNKIEFLYGNNGTLSIRYTEFFPIQCRLLRTQWTYQGLLIFQKD